MTANPHLIPQLDAYLAQSEPGFAILIDAPWGAGKTHAIKAWLNGKPHCYVSLFGVASIQDIEEALFNRLMERQDIKPPNGFNQIAEGMTKKFTGVTIDLTGFHRQQVMKSLPKLLIFDDLERAQMPPPALLAALNRFVEHEGRQVILIANEAELTKAEDYRRWREKVVGRTITLKPETDSALNACLASLAAGEQQEFLTTHRELIITVFQISQTDNLRLLRQSVKEFAAFHGMLPEDIRNKTSGMKYLLGSFFALSIAYHAGQITKDDLLQPVTYRLPSDRKNERREPPPTQFEVLTNRFTVLPSVMFGGHALPGKLARLLIGDGYAPPEIISSALRDLTIFRNEEDEPWVKLAYWRRRDEAEVETALGCVQAQIANREITSPTIILHLWGIFTDLAEYGITDQTKQNVTLQFKDYITTLEALRSLPDNYTKNSWENPLLNESSHGLGYFYRETAEFQCFRDDLIAALDRTYRAGDEKRLANLLSLATTDVEAFALAISDQGDQQYIAHEPIFADADPEHVANILFSLSPAKMQRALRPFEDRLLRLEGIPGPEVEPKAIPALEHPERIFLMRMRDAANRIADGATNIRAAQIRNALKWHLGFLDPLPP
jgi:hypothetical protein